jgi:DNA mismatch repair protein MutS
VRIATQLRDDLARAPGWLARSRALQGLHAHLVALTGTHAFRALQEELPRLRATLDRVRSVTIGINLTRDLSPDSATIISIDAQKVEGRSVLPLLDRLFGQGSAEKALSPLYDVDLANPGNPLTRDLQKLLAAVIAPVSDAMRRHTHTNAQSLDHLERELSFFLNAVKLTRKLEEAGLPTCRAEIAPAEERVTVLADAYNVGLALRSPEGHAIIANNVTFDGQLGRVWILTGPNRGGKTTYTRSVGQAHVLFQAGLRVPARQARLSPAGSIYSHFPTPESEQLGMGKLDEEAKRLAEIFRFAAPTSLILLNEVLAGTSAIEALGLATDAVRALRLLGCRAIYTTHLHELPSRTDEINATTPGDSLVGSLVAGVEMEEAVSPPGPTTNATPPAGVISSGHRRTFRIHPGPPQNVSYASEIAEQHGISFAQLQRLFEKRGVIPPQPPTHSS